ncbi:hypothetical protein ACTXT7_017168, partial [Hymenolepis weldensis]
NGVLTGGYICAYVLTRPYPSDSYGPIFVFPSNNAFVSVTGSYTLTAHLLSSSARSPLPTYLSLSLASMLVVASLNTF